MQINNSEEVSAAVEFCNRTQPQFNEMKQNTLVSCKIRDRWRKLR